MALAGGPVYLAEFGHGIHFASHFELLADTQVIPVDPCMDSNHELDKILKAHNLLILKSH